jgi:hypothetical protein
LKPNPKNVLVQPKRIVDRQQLFGIKSDWGIFDFLIKMKNEKISNTKDM